MSATLKTVLTSLTGNNVNITTGNETHIKGSLVAAGDKDANGVFRDNNNLNLSTKTLTFENLANTKSSNSTGLGIGAGVNSQGGVSSVSAQISTGTSYERTKTLATLGNGNITITDTTNSDEMERLNRDTTNITKALVKTSTGTSASGTLDTRLLTEAGRAQIAKDATTAKEHTQDIANGIITVATKDTINITNLVDKVRDNISATKLKDYLTQTPQGQQVLEGLKADPQSQEYHDAQIAANQKLQEFRGLEVEKVVYYDAKATTNEALKDKTIYNIQTDTQGATITKGDNIGTILLDASGNALNLSSKQTDTIASGHEVGEVTYLQNGYGLFFTDSYDTKEAMNDAYGTYYAQRLNEATSGAIHDIPYPTNTNTPFIQLGTNTANGIIIPDNGVEYRKVNLNVRSFAPVPTFGGGTILNLKPYHGDDRGFTTDPDVTSRVAYIANIDTTKNTMTHTAFSSPSDGGPFNNGPKTASPEYHGSYNSNGDIAKFDYAASNPLMPGAPDVDVKGNLEFIDHPNGSFSIKGDIKGDDFPSAEAFVSVGSKNTPVFLGVSQINSDQGLSAPSVGLALSGLLGTNKPMMNVDMTINFDKNDVPSSVSSGGKTYTIEQWNSYFSKLPAKEK